MASIAELLAAPKTDRYRIDVVLGRGGSSLVYKAFDLEDNFFVALKAIRFPDQDTIYRLKQEFRAFRDFFHPNIVEFYNLHVEDNSCFYTMELVEGVDFVRFVRQHPARLRSCLAQLADGLAAVHQCGRLHGDLKPSNVLVESTGRTVLLDFGLAVEARPSDSLFTRGQLYGGTPAYMAPEQLNGEPATEASDLYALGVVLYESLTFCRPFGDLAPLARYQAEQAGAPPAPQAIDPDAPRDLSDLALGLLSFDARDRPALADVQRRIQDRHVPARPTSRADERSPPFVDRVSEMEQVRSALKRTLSGRRVVVHVSGVSGVGKSTLIERFLSQAREELGALALRSRCHHQESVRYNALDGLIDMLSRHLVDEPEDRLAHIMPDGLAALVTMFPVLARVAWPAVDMDPDNDLADPQSLVRQAVSALRQLMRQIAAGRPLILWIDDLQWSDAGSLPLLAEIVGGGEEPIQTIFSYRLEDVRQEPVTIALGIGVGTHEPLEVEHVRVGPLDPASVGDLVRELASDARPNPSLNLPEIVELSAGLPFFVLQLANEGMSFENVDASAEARRSDRGDRLLANRLGSLSGPQRAILEIVAVSGRPLPDRTLIRIATSDSASGREIYQLLNQHLLRKAELSGTAAVETYHDRIRTAVLGALPLERRQNRHRQIAEELERASELDHPMLVEHFLGAADVARASDHAILAARAAGHRLVFSQAVEFLLLASRLRDPLADGAALAAELAEAFANAGRSSEAADLFLRAANANPTDPGTASRYQAMAARHLLYSGRLSESRALHRKLFTDLGIAFPQSARDAHRMSILNRLAFGIGLYRLRPARSPDAVVDTGRIDTLWSAAIGFLMLDYSVGDAMLTRFMREAASLGEGSRVLRASALEASAMANIGRSWTMRRAEGLLRLSDAYAARSQDPYDQVVLLTCRGSAYWFRGLWKDAAELTHEAIEKHRRECVRYDFVVSIARGYRIAALALQGAIGAAKAEASSAVENARARGDVYVSRSFRSGYSVYVALAEDSPDAVIADSATLLDDLPSDRFTSLHWMHFTATANALVYAGRPWEAWTLVQTRWPMIRAEGFLRLGCIGAHLREIRARVALSCAASGRPPDSLRDWGRNRLLQSAEQDAKAIGRTRTLSHAAATSAAIRSSVAALNGSTERQAELLEKARRGYDAAGMTLYSRAAEMQLDAARASARRLDPEAPRAAMAAEGVRRPERMAAFLTFAL